MKKIFIIAGSFFVGVGFIGIFIPLLPTTPFLLLATACYIRGSKKMYDWLIGNRWLGIYIKHYFEGKGIPLKIKAISICTLWLTITFSIFLIINSIIIKFILIIIAIGVTIHLITLSPLKK